MKKFIYLAVISFLLLASDREVSAQAMQDFTITNYTGVTIMHLYISPSKSAEWGEDILGVDYFSTDTYIPIKFGPNADFCFYDIRVTDKDNNYMDFNEINLCQWSELELYFDQNTATGTVKYK